MLKWSGVASKRPKVSMKKFKLPIALLVVAVAILLLPIVASADHQWGRYAWPSSPAVSLGDNVSDNWDGFLTAVNDDWNVSTVINNTVDPGRTNPIDCNPATGDVEICNALYGHTGWLGIAGIWIAKGKQITKAYVKVNDTFFDDPDNTYGGFYNTSSWRQMVMCQEVGHVFGLAHQDEDFYNANLGTCMDYTSNPDGPLSNLQPNQHDYDQLLAIYGSSDDDGGKKGNNGGGKGKKGDPPGQSVREWGKPISTDGKGRPDLFELDLGKGNKLFTHVLWAD